MKRFQAPTEWTTEFASEGCFSHLNDLVAFDEWPKWPSCKALMSLLPYDVENLNNKTIEFTLQDEAEDYSAVAYEEYIFATGKVPTRRNSWHDIFGALSWCLFPTSKAKVNQLHHADIKANGTVERSKLRNALTLFDECGVVLVTQNQTLIDALQQHRWQEAFIELRQHWGEASKDGVAVYNFGHANYEMLTKPFVGLTGKWLVIDASAEVLSLPLNVQYRRVDEKLCALLENGVLKDNSAMYPLPLLGVPNWYEANNNSEFYQNTEYFRPKRNKE